MFFHCKVLYLLLHVYILTIYRLPPPPVQAMELNPLAAQKADQSCDYEDIYTYIAAASPPPPSAGGPATGEGYNVLQFSKATALPGKPTSSDVAQYSEVMAPAGKPAACDGDYDIVKPPVPTGGAGVSGDGYDVVQCIASTGAAAPVGGATTTNGDDYDITKCPAYAPPQGQRSVAPLNLEDGGVEYRNIKSESTS